MSNAKKGQYVEIQVELLNPHQRSTRLPDDTKKLAYIARIKGFLNVETASIGDTVKINSPIGRTIEGTLIGINPPFVHDFGAQVPELLDIGNELRNILSNIEAR
jgi:hypothetical protein